MIVARGLGANCASYGTLPAGYTCVDSASGNATLVPPGGSFSAAQTDSFGQVGGVDCATAQAALQFDPSLAALMPPECIGASFPWGTVALVAVLVVGGFLISR